MWDHPHERGDWEDRAAFGAACDGSSPRAWGLGPEGLAVVRPARIIPTSVGTGRRSASSWIRGTDHPHERGDWAEV